MACSEQILSLSFFSRASRLKLLRHVIRDAADMIGLGGDETDAIVLAVNEACMNIIQHSYHMRPDGRIDVEICRDGEAIIFRLRDYADRVDIETVHSRDLEDIRPGGLGVHLISCLMDEYGFLEPPEGEGNLFEMKKYVKA